MGQLGVGGWVSWESVDRSAGIQLSGEMPAQALAQLLLRTHNRHEKAWQAARQDHKHTYTKHAPPGRRCKP